MQTNGSILVAACLVLAVRKYMPQEAVVRHIELLEATLSSNGTPPLAPLETSRPCVLCQHVSQQLRRHQRPS